MNYMQKHAALYKLSQVKNAINYVARQRGLLKSAETQAERIKKLQALSESSSLGSILSGAALGGVSGMGLGAGISATLGGVGGYLFPTAGLSDAEKEMYERFSDKQKAMYKNDAANVTAAANSWRGGVIGGLLGTGLGGIAAYMRQNAIREAAKKELAALGIK